jgi:CBS domain containing-hemolysin-like protein
MSLLLGLTVIVVLIGISVVISLSEIAFAAAREVRIRALAEGGDKRAERFVALRADASRVITALQICMNAVSILAGIVGDSLFGPIFAAGFVSLGAGEWAEPAGSVFAFCLLTGLFVLFADLVPKKIAMLIPEEVALSVGWFPLYAVAVLRPLVWFFSVISDWVIALFKLSPSLPRDEVTSEDFRMILAGGAESGALMMSEHRLIENVLALERRSVTSVMTIRDDIVYLDIREPPEVQRGKVQRRPFSHYPICDGGIDAVIGCVRAEDILATAIDKSDQIDFAAVRRDVLSVPDTLNIWEVLAEFQAQGAGFALVVSEYALVLGVVTFKDLMGALVQGLANPFEEQPILRRDENSWLVDGIAPLDDVARVLSIRNFPVEGAYETIGGFIVHRLRRAARKGDKVEEAGYIFEVVDADRVRLNQLLVTRRPAAGHAPR